MGNNKKWRPVAEVTKETGLTRAEVAALAKNINSAKTQVYVDKADIENMKRGA